MLQKQKHKHAPVLVGLAPVVVRVAPAAEVPAPAV